MAGLAGHREQLKHAELVTADGTPVGVVEGIYLDEPNGEPEWALRATRWFGHRATFVPLPGARFKEGLLRVAFD